MKIIKSKTDLGIIKFYSLQIVHVYCEHLFITNSLKIIKVNIDHFPPKRVIVLNEAYKFKEEKDSSLLLYCYLIFFVINRRSQYT